MTHFMLLFSITIATMTIGFVAYGTITLLAIRRLTKRIDKQWTRTLRAISDYNKSIATIPQDALLPAGDIDQLLQRAVTATRSGDIGAITQAQKALQRAVAAEQSPLKRKVARSMVQKIVAKQDSLQGAQLLLNREIATYNDLVSRYPSIVIARLGAYQPVAFLEFDVVSFD